MKPNHIQIAIDVVYTPDYSSFGVNKRRTDKDHSEHRLARLRKPLFSDLQMQVLVLPPVVMLVWYFIYLFPCA
jgi:hypothetical protein